MSMRFGVCALLLMLFCGSVAEAATFCVTSGNQLNIALQTAEFNSEHDTIKVATGTHITDYHAPGAYQWSYEPANQAEDSDYEYNLTISGGWNAADNCQTQWSKDPAATVLDARYWGPVFSVTAVYLDFIGHIHISNLTFYRGESNNILGEAGMRVIVGGANNPSITFDNILVSGNRSGANLSSIAQFSLSGAGDLKIRNSEFLNNSFTHASSGGLSFMATDGAEGWFTNNSISGNTATDDRKGLSVLGLVTLSNNAIGDNPSTAPTSYDFMSTAGSSLTLVNNHFQTSSITGGSPSESGTTDGDPQWTLVVARMVPDLGSPLRDSGNNTPTGGVPNIDFSGQPRIVNVTIDRGAVEAEAPPASEVGPLVTAVSPADGSTTVFQGPIGSGFVGTQLTFNVSGGVAPGVTELECEVTSGAPAFGIASPGDTVGVGELMPPIDVGFDNITSELQTATVTCAVVRELAGTSYLTYNFVAAPPGGPAIFDSSPKKSPDPASTIDLTDPYGAVLGTDLFGETLRLLNVADLGDSDMQVFCELSGGSDPEITASPAEFNGDLISPQGALEVLFDCDTSTLGSYTATYNCTYDLDDTQDPAATDGTAQYQVECDVRPPPETHVETTPSGGTTTTKVVGPGGSASFDFTFAEVSPDPDPPADANLLDCAIVDDAHGAFSIQSPGFPGGPYPIVKGSPVGVQVLGTDTSGQELYTATLHCEYTDTDHLCPSAGAGVEPAEPAPACGTADFPLQLQVRDEARFHVTKAWDGPGQGNNEAEVDVTISCNTGLPLEQTASIDADDSVIFVVESFDTGELDCEITEAVPAGYEEAYCPGANSEAAENCNDEYTDKCEFKDVEGNDVWFCRVVNRPVPVEVKISKEWVINGALNGVSDEFQVRLECETEIHSDNAQECGEACYYLILEGSGGEKFAVDVTPGYPHSSCSVEETLYDDAIETSNDCAEEDPEPGLAQSGSEPSASEFWIGIGEGHNCTITNTVFFEGIPALNPYGLAVLMLSMLGLGFVAYRRFA